MIHLIDNRTDEVLGFISEDKLLEATHVQDADSKTETLNFMVLIERGVDGLTERNRAIFKDDDGTFREVIIENIEDTNDERMIYANASYLEDLDNAKPIPPDGKDQYTKKQWTGYALTDTGWKPGIIEYDGFRSIPWTSHNTPYELLTIIANRFDMSLRFRTKWNTTKWSAGMWNRSRSIICSAARRLSGAKTWTYSNASSIRKKWPQHCGVSDQSRPMKKNNV